MNWRSAVVALLCLCSLMAVGYLLGRRVERRAAGWLFAFALAVTVNSIPLIIGFAGAYDRWPQLTFLPTQMTLWFGPFIYLHARTLMQDGPLGAMRWLLLPGGLYLLYLCWAFVFLGDYRRKWAFNEQWHDPYVLPVVFYAGLALTVWALVSIWRMRARYLAWLASHRSDDDIFEPLWLSRFVLFGIPIAALWAAENILGRALGLNYFERFWADFAVLFLVMLVCVEALVRIQRPFPKMAQGAEAAAAPAPDAVVARDWSAEGEQLRSRLIAEQWYLEPGFSLAALSRRMGSNQAYVSRALNEGLGLSFSDLVNGQRAAHAQRLLMNSSMSMLEVAMASGFGSKASFNRVFRAKIGRTPSQVRSSAGSADVSDHKSR